MPDIFFSLKVTGPEHFRLIKGPFKAGFTVLYEKLGFWGTMDFVNTLNTRQGLSLNRSKNQPNHVLTTSQTH
jgi:hypothetical protein